MATMSQSSLHRSPALTPPKPTHPLSRFIAILKELTPRTRGLLGGGIVTIVLFAALVGFHNENSRYQPLFPFPLSEADQRDVSSLLSGSGDEFHVDGGRITVPPDQRHRIVAWLVAEHGLPHRPIVQPANTGSLVPNSDSEAKRQALLSLQNDLTQEIRGFSFVRDCSVHLVAPEESPDLSGGQKPGTASIMLDLSPGHDPSSEQIQALASVVAYSVPGLKADDVSVVSADGRNLSAKKSPSVLSNDRIELKMAYEWLFSSKVRASLDKELGPGTYTLVVDCDLDFTHSVSKTTQSGEAKPTETTTHKETLDTADPTARPHTAEGVALPVPSDRATNYVREDDKVKNQFDVAEQTRDIPAGLIRKVTATLAIDRPLSPSQKADYERGLWDALGMETSRGDRVSVRQGTFLHPTLSPSACPAPAAPERVNPHPGLAIALTLAGIVGLLGFSVFREHRREKETRTKYRSMASDLGTTEISDLNHGRDGRSTEPTLTTRAHFQTMARERPTLVVERLREVWRLESER